MSVPVGTCLQCQETPASIKAQGIVVCGIIEGYEYPELVAEWERHHWRDWSDRELAACQIKPEAYEKYRRASIPDLEWSPCIDNIHGHKIMEDDSMKEDWGVSEGGCIRCFKKAEDVAKEQIEVTALTHPL